VGDIAEAFNDHIGGQYLFFSQGIYIVFVVNCYFYSEINDSIARLHACQPRQSHERGKAKTFAAIPADDRKRVLGFYSLSPASIGYARTPALVHICLIKPTTSVRPVRWNSSLAKQSP
jgi:hypothetical protein